MLETLGLVKEAVIMSARNIKSNKMRSFLTTLGIIIGVMSVISLVTLVSSVTDELMNQLNDIGAGIIVINSYGTPLKQGLSEYDLNEICKIDNVLGASPSVSFETSAVRNGNISEKVSVLGKNEFFFRKNKIVKHGRPFYSIDMSGESYVCIVDKVFAKKQFFGEDPVGQHITLNGIEYLVVGMQTEDDDSVSSSMSQSADDGTVYIPYKNAMKMSGFSHIKSLDVYLDDTSKSYETQKEVENYLKSAFNNKKDSYWIMNLDSLVKAYDTMMSMMTGLLGGIASIALLVGGIGIMNMMLVSVTERTKEIGLRKALGATPSRIQAQFLLEAVFLSLLGGAIGMILGISVSMLAAKLLKIKFVLSVSAIELGVGFSAGVGIIFGWAPAKKASNLNPIDALRSE